MPANAGEGRRRRLSTEATVFQEKFFFGTVLFGTALFKGSFFGADLIWRVLSWHFFSKGPHVLGSFFFGRLLPGDFADSGRSLLFPKGVLATVVCYNQNDNI
jgi:hypothetical protein